MSYINNKNSNRNNNNDNKNLNVVPYLNTFPNYDNSHPIQDAIPNPFPNPTENHNQIKRNSNQYSSLSLNLNLNEQENENVNQNINPNLRSNLNDNEKYNNEYNNDNENSRIRFNVNPEINIIKEKEKEKAEINHKEKLKSLFKMTLYNSCDLFKYAYFSFCSNEKFKKKFQKFNLAKNRIHKSTDFLEMIKLLKEFNIVKYLLLNNLQQKSLDFINNLTIDKEGYSFEDDSFPEVLESGFDRFEYIKILRKYFQTKIQYGNLSVFDKKILNVLQPDIKEILENI